MALHSGSNAFFHVPRLPTEVLQIIFSFIPLQPRILVVRLVCKQWSLAVMPTVTELPHSSAKSLKDVISRCPNITAWQWPSSELPEEVFLPLGKQLQSLRIFPNEATNSVLYRTSSQLTFLSVLSRTASWRRVSETIAANPNLRHLHIRTVVSPLPELLIPLQLTSLSLYATSLQQSDLCTLKLPDLVHLSLFGVTLINAAFAAWLKSLPKLRELVLLSNQPVHEVAMARPDCLIEIRARTEATANDLLALSKCPKLHHIHFPTSVRLMLPYCEVVGTQLSELTLLWSMLDMEEGATVLSKCSNLTSLTIGGTPGGRCETLLGLLPKARFTKLCSIRFYSVCEPNAAFLRSLMKISPALRRVSFDTIAFTDAGPPVNWAANIYAGLREVAELGLEYFSMHGLPQACYDDWKVVSKSRILWLELVVRQRK